jgi:hypothetical protein
MGEAEKQKKLEEAKFNAEYPLGSYKRKILNVSKLMTTSSLAECIASIVNVQVLFLRDPSIPDVHRKILDSYMTVIGDVRKKFLANGTNESNLDDLIRSYGNRQNSQRPQERFATYKNCLEIAEKGTAQ